MSPILLELYIDDLIKELNNAPLGIDIDNLNVSLFYADDIVLLETSENNLKKMLDIVHNWCKKWTFSMHYY